MAIHSSTLAWKIPWTEEPNRLHSPWGCKELQRHDFTFTFTLHGNGAGVIQLMILLLCQGNSV